MTTTGRTHDQHEHGETATTSRTERDRSASAVARIQPAQLITATSPTDPADMARLRAHLRRVEPGPVWLDEVQFDSLAEALMAAGRRIAKSLASMREHLEAAGLLVEQPPADPKARALWLVQHRNTGPAQRQRAPRRLDTTARRARRSSW